MKHVYKKGDLVRAVQSTALLKLNKLYILTDATEPNEHGEQILYVTVEEDTDSPIHNWSYNDDYFELVTTNNRTVWSCKSWPHFFQAIKNGDKLHDLRQMDRDFKVGDYIDLFEFDPVTGKYTGEEVKVEITYITSNTTPCALSSNALAKDHCILSLKLVK